MLNNSRASVTMLTGSWRRISVMEMEQGGFTEKRSSVFAKSFSSPRTEMLHKEPGDQEESKLPMNNFY